MIPVNNSSNRAKNVLFADESPPPLLLMGTIRREVALWVIGGWKGRIFAFFFWSLLIIFDVTTEVWILEAEERMTGF